LKSLLTAHGRASKRIKQFCAQILALGDGRNRRRR
jgi:hypothetical protein